MKQDAALIQVGHEHIRVAVIVVIARRHAGARASAVREIASGYVGDLRRRRHLECARPPIRSTAITAADKALRLQLEEVRATRNRPEFKRVRLPPWAESAGISALLSVH